MRRTLGIAALGLVTILRGGGAQAQSLSLALDRLATSQSDTVRENALSELIWLGRAERIPICSPSASPDIKRVLIVALETENELVYGQATYSRVMRPGSPGRLSESEMEYYANLIGCVAGLRDSTALRGLLGAIDTGGGAINGVVSLGEHGVPALIELLDTPGSRGRVAALLALGKLAGRTPFPLSIEPLPPLSAGTLAAIRARLLVALNDESSVAREVAIASLTPFNDPGVRRAIESVAGNDPTTIDLRGRVYPVRAAARKWLEQDSLKKREMQSKKSP